VKSCIKGGQQAAVMIDSNVSLLSTNLDPAAIEINLTLKLVESLNDQGS